MTGGGCGWTGPKGPRTTDAAHPGRGSEGFWLKSPLNTTAFLLKLFPGTPGGKNHANWTDADSGAEGRNEARAGPWGPLEQHPGGQGDCRCRPVDAGPA